MTRKYSSTSVETTLAVGLSNNGTTMIVASGTGSALIGGLTLAAGNVDQFAVALDPDTANEEIVFVTAVSSDTLTVVRGCAGTSAIAHTGGAKVKHVLTGDDATFFTTGVATADAAIAKSLLTTKGDIIAATGASTPARLGVGTSAQVLTVDSTTATGLKWDTPTTLNITFNAQTGTTYTLVAGDLNKLVTLSNASTITLTVPSGVFATGQQINIQRLGAGAVQIRNNGTSVLTSTGVTSGAPNLRAQFSAATIICTSSNNFTVIGDIS